MTQPAQTLKKANKIYETSDTTKKELIMNQPSHISYLFDPFCGWCYGASSALHKIHRLENVVIELTPTGLFAGNGARPMDQRFAQYAWSNDQRIEQLTGRQFSDKYHREVLGNHDVLFDSSNAILALSAVTMTEPKRALEALLAIQEARYIDGLDTTSLEVLVSVLNKLKLTQAASKVLVQDSELNAINAAKIAMTRQKMQTYQIEGVPNLIVIKGQNQRIIDGSYLYANTSQLLDYLKYD